MSQESEDRRECVSCADRIIGGCGIVCAADHALCDDCFNTSVLTQTEAFDAFVRREAKLVCLYCKPHTVLTPAMQVKAMQRLNAEGQVAYLRARDEYAAQQERARLGKENDELRAQVARGGADAAQRVRHHVVRIDEEVLTLHCPKCRRPTEGKWDACFKISCGGCNGSFCAWCLQTPASHEHVGSCASNPHRGSIYGNLKEWETVRKPARVAQLRAYLHEHVRADDQMELVTALTPHLAHAGTRPHEIHDAVEFRLSPVWT